MGGRLTVEDLPLEEQAMLAADKSRTLLCWLPSRCHTCTAWLSGQWFQVSLSSEPPNQSRDLQLAGTIAIRQSHMHNPAPPCQLGTGVVLVPSGISSSELDNCNLLYPALEQLRLHLNTVCNDKQLRRNRVRHPHRQRVVRGEGEGLWLRINLFLAQNNRRPGGPTGSGTVTAAGLGIQSPHSSTAAPCPPRCPPRSYNPR